MLIYLRHGHDEYEDATYNHDNQITNQGRKGARILAKKLFRKYGQPTLILCSPFRRTLQTLSEMVKILPTVPQVEHCPHLSRYFGSKDRLNPDICPTTDKYDIPIEEGREGFKRRVREHILITEQYASDQVIWCITHAIVYKRVARHYGIPCPRRIDFLSHFVVEPPKHDSKNKIEERNRIRIEDRNRDRDQDRIRIQGRNKNSIQDNLLLERSLLLGARNRAIQGNTHRGIASKVRKPPRDPIYFEMFGSDYIPGKM